MRFDRYILACAVCLASAGAAGAQDRIVAVVNNEVITQKDLEGFTLFNRMQMSQKLEGQALEDKLSAMKKDLLQRLIEDRLILQEAKKSGVKVDDSRVKAKIAEVKKRYDTEKEFNEALMQQGLSASDVESRIRDQMMMYSLIDKKIREKIEIAPAAITAYYEEHKQEMGQPEQRDVVSVSADSESGAQELCAALRQGKDIESLADGKSVKVNSFSTHPGELKKEVNDAVFGLAAAGAVSDPVSVNGAFYVFKLKAISPAKEQSLSDVQEEISQILFEKKMQEDVAAWLDGVKKTAYIKIME
jgi:parvulin-like peptidyl-prolyl isomerase